MVLLNFKNKCMQYAMLCCGLALAAQVHAEQAITVYAAASLTNAIADVDAMFEQQKRVRVKTSYAGSSTLAKQIEAGAPADVFISADEQWMNYLQNKKLIVPNKRVNLLGNRLVLISPKAKPVKIKMDKSFDPSTAFQGKLCTGDTKSVPVGKYGKQALTALGWWSKLEPRLVETEDVRAALNFVARGECQLGIVYATDAAISKDVTVVGVFPINTHTPIVYPLGLVKNNPDALAFYQFVQSKQAYAVFKKYGFTVLSATK